MFSPDKDKLKAFKIFIKEAEKIQNNKKLKALKSFIQKGPINIVKRDGDIDLIDRNQIISNLPYNEMVTDEQKKLIGRKRYDTILVSFIDNLQNSLWLNPQQFEELYLDELKSLFLEHVKTLYNIYAMTPEIKDPA